MKQYIKLENLAEYIIHPESSYKFDHSSTKKTNTRKKIKSPERYFEK